MTSGVERRARYKKLEGLYEVFVLFFLLKDKFLKLFVYLPVLFLGMEARHEAIIQIHIANLIKMRLGENFS